MDHLTSHDTTDINSNKHNHFLLVSEQTSKLAIQCVAINRILFCAVTSYSYTFTVAKNKIIQ